MYKFLTILTFFVSTILAGPSPASNECSRLFDQISTRDRLNSEKLLRLKQKAIDLVQDLTKEIQLTKRNGLVQNYNFIQDSKIMLTFSRYVLESVFEKGFLNQHETGFGLIYRPEENAYVENQIIGHNLQHLETIFSKDEINKIRPKYALLQLTNPSFLVELDADYNSQTGGWGEITAIFHDDVKSRTTWTALDSGSLGVQPEAIKKLKGTFSQNAQVDVDAFSHYSQNSLGKYFEAQIWGPLDVSDVDYFLVTDRLPQGILDLLKKVGKPVYEYRIIEFHGRHLSVPTRQL